MYGLPRCEQEGFCSLVFFLEEENVSGSEPAMIQVERERAKR